jgi:hypothetical protein
MRANMDRIVQLEIRGVGGATAEETLGGAVTQVAGDRSAGFYTPDVPDSNKRDVEAYEWGRLTSGAWSSAVWWILFPFTLMNVAGWMFQPTATEREHSDEAVRSSLWWGRLLVVLGGLAITAVYVVWTVTLTTEIVAFGCADSVECSSRWYVGPVGWFDSNPVWLVTVGIGLAALLILGLFLFILRSQDKLEGYEADPTRRAIGATDQRRSNTNRLRRNTTLKNQGFWYRWEEHRRLFRWHLGLTMALLGAAAGHALDRASWITPPGGALFAMALVALAVVIALWWLSGPEKFRDTDGGSRGDTVDTKRQAGWTIAHILLAVTGYLVAIAAGDVIDATVTTPFGFLDAIRGLSTVFYFFGVVTLGLLVYRRFFVSDHAKLGGALWLFPVLAAGLSITIAGAGFVAVAHVLGRAMRGAQWVADNGFDIVLVDILVASIIVSGILLTIRHRFLTKPTAEVRADYFTQKGPLTDRQNVWVRAVAKARMLAKLPSTGDGLILVLVSVLLLFTGLQAWSGDFNISAGADSAFAAPLLGIDGLSFIHPAAAIFIVLYVFPGVQLIRKNAQSRASRRQLGKVWDVLSFWPRRFHPLAAPCYAERAVPEFRDRIRHHLLDGRTVIISSHSQGTVIAFAALVQIAAEHETVGFEFPHSDAPTAANVTTSASDSETASYSSLAEPETRLDESALTKVGLVTFGSPLSSLYGRFFPENFGAPELFQSLRDRLATLRPSVNQAWRNLWRPTDYIGQKVFVAPGGVLSPPDPKADIRVLEALEAEFPYESHSNYEREEQLKDTIDLIAREIV